jgi:hypothetical protein
VINVCDSILNTASLVTGFERTSSNSLLDENVSSYAVQAIIGVFQLILSVDLIMREAVSPSTKN